MTVPLQTLVETTDIEARLGETLAGPQIIQVNSLIELASEKLRTPAARAVIGDIDERITDGTLRIGLVRGILVTVVHRAFDALRVGTRVRSEQYPEIQTTYADPDQELVYFTDEEMASLAPEPDKSATGGAFTIRLGR